MANESNNDVPNYAKTVLSGFARFSGGVTVSAPQQRAVEHVLGEQEISVAVPTVNGMAVGEVAQVDFWVDLRQLELAPREDLLCSRYEPNEDPDFDRLKEALRACGDELPSLPVLPANRSIILPVKGEVPMYTVYDQPEIYYALVALSDRSRARVHIPRLQRPGQILLASLAQHGQLRREPSYLEVCLAARRLKETYGFTLAEIALMQTRDPDDTKPPSTTQVHYQIQVAGLPESVHDLLHKGHIRWSHAREIATFCDGDQTLGARLALFVAQESRMTVEALGYLIKQMRDGICRLEIDEGVVYKRFTQRFGPVTALTTSPSAKPTVFYRQMMAAQPAQVRRAAGTFTVDLIPADAPEKIAVPAQALDPLRAWLADRRTSTAVRDIETELLGFLEAVRFAGVRQELINKEGQFASVVDSSPLLARHGS